MMDPVRLERLEYRLEQVRSAVKELIARNMGPACEVIHDDVPEDVCRAFAVTLARKLFALPSKPKGDCLMLWADKAPVVSWTQEDFVMVLLSLFRRILRNRTEFSLFAEEILRKIENEVFEGAFE